MKIVKTKAQVRQEVAQARREGKTVGFVPTMGYLHQGHLSLMEAARKENDIVVASIFVNPTQFGPNEDLDTYPRDLERDAKLAESVGVDLIFNPEVEEMYSNHFQTHVEVTEVSQNLCGAKRPGHFRGVCTVVSKLFNIVQPDCAYFGQKDAQQVIVIKRMVQDLDMPVQVKTCPIVREEDGLAMSSRNKYLSPEEREQALVLNKSLKKAQELIDNGVKDVTIIKDTMEKMIRDKELAKIDYVSIVSAETLQEIDEIKGSILIALAVYVGKTRLIDNIMLEVR